MFFERFWGFRAFASTAKTFGVSAFLAAILIFSSVCGANAATRTAANEPNSGAARARGVANAVSTGIPSRLEAPVEPQAPTQTAAPSGTVRVRTRDNSAVAPASPSNAVRRGAVRPANAETPIRETSRAVSNAAAPRRPVAPIQRAVPAPERRSAPIQGAAPVPERPVVINNNGENVPAPADESASDAAPETLEYRQTFDAPTPLPTVGFRLQIKRFATREEAERAATADGGYWAILPRENFLKVNPDDPQNSTNAARAGIDSRVSTPAQTPASTPTLTAAPTSGADEEPGFVAIALTGLRPDEARLLRDAEDGRWSDLDLFEAALIAEGLTTARGRAPYRAKYEKLVDELSAATAFAPDALSKTEAVYTFLHEKVLTAQYNLNCSSLVSALDSGVFNCVSATTLFNCFARRSGLNVAALETTGHAKSRVKFADSFLDLETTCSTWARLPDKLRPYSRSVAVARPVRPSAGIDATVPNGDSRISNATAFANGGAGSQAIVRGADGDVRSAANSGSGVEAPNAVNAVVSELGSTTFDPRTFEAEGAAPIGYSHTKNRRPMREIGEVELVATIYYNVGVDFYQNERYEEAIVAYIKAARLAPNNLTILGNLKATLNNWAIQIAMKEKDFERAIQITEQGMILDPNFDEYKMNLPIFFQHWTTYLAKDNRWDEVARVEKEYLKRFPKPTIR